MNGEGDEKYPLYPVLSEEAEQEAQLLFDAFRKKLTGIAHEVLSTLYTDVAFYIESDSWTNFRNQILDGFRNYNNRKIQAKYDFDEIRRTMFEQYRDEIMKEMPEELVKENEKLRETIKHLQDVRIF